MLPQVSSDLNQTPDVPRKHRLRPGFEDVLHLALAEPFGHFRLRQVVTARRPAANLALREGDEFQSRDHLQELPRRLADLLSVAQVTGVMIGRPQVQRVRRQHRAESLGLS